MASDEGIEAAIVDPEADPEVKEEAGVPSPSAEAESTIVEPDAEDLDPSSPGVEEEEEEEEPPPSRPPHPRAPSEEVARVAESLDSALARCADIVSFLSAVLRHNLDATGAHLAVHRDAADEAYASARTAVGMSHGLVEACMQVGSDGRALVAATRERVARVRRQVDTVDALITKSGILS